MRPRTKNHRDKPEIGRGKYVKAPLLRDKATNPRWMANAMVNNPGNTLAGAGIGAGGVLLSQDRKVSKAKKEDVAGGALVGGGAAHFARVGADYGTKSLAERQFKPLTTKGNYGPYTETPHKPVLNKYKRTARGDVRTKAKMFDENFPKGVPSYRARKAGVILGKKPVVAGVVAGGAAIGALAPKKRKTMDVSKGWEMNNKAPAKDKRKFQAAGLTAAGASGVGGYLYGAKAGDIAAGEIAERSWAGQKVGAKHVGRALGSGFKVAHKTKTGKVGLGMGAAGVAAAHVNAQRAKKKGTIIQVKKNHTLSAFGVEHGGA
jgi:hypothetical protein